MSKPEKSRKLSIEDHSRDSAGMKYVYPVLSRRARGVSLGVNLNPNNACNWACAYCQVDGLVRGQAPRIDLGLLEKELRSFFKDLSSYFEESLPENCRELKDLAFSGNGEPTSSKQLPMVIGIVEKVLRDTGYLQKIPIRLITNGSRMDRPENIEALQKLSTVKGEVWFKIDSVLPDEIERLNGVKIPISRIRENLKTSSKHCPTWIQSCLVSWNGKPPPEESRDEYRRFFQELLKEKVQIQGILLYSLAREAKQPSSAHVSKLSKAEMEEWARLLREDGLSVEVFD